MSSLGPSASNDSVSTSENTAVLIDVTDNDTDPDGDALTVEIDDAPSDGEAVVQGGSILMSSLIRSLIRVVLQTQHL